ncbi:RHS repeat-associated core domain-containing protein [uncultured Planktosalinus sp.]|uniref:RHS repeat-associated core domain-containing protein n=1 Tax=uncultured Planktosalinus sp. TaxID=1810935 RepID=UPI0030DBF4E9
MYRGLLYKFGGKELQTEFGVEMYDFGARNYDPALGRWMNIDPLAEEYPDWTPYRYGFNNPVRYTDPTGLMEWDPQVNEDGSTSYIAEAGDSAETFASQYGFDQETAETITGTTGNTEIAEGTEVSGGKVKEVTGSEALKLDLDSPEGKSSQRRFDHFMFAADHSRSQGAWAFLSTDYFSNTQFKEMMSGWATLTTGDRSFQVYYDIPMYRSGTFDGSSTGVGISMLLLL